MLKVNDFGGVEFLSNIGSGGGSLGHSPETRRLFLDLHGSFERAVCEVEQAGHRGHCEVIDGDFPLRLAMTTRSGTIEGMDVQDIVRQVEAETGFPVQIGQDSTIGQMATVRMARGPLRLHQIRIHPAHSGLADYLIASQCGLILRKFGVPPEGRFDLASSREGRQQVERLIGEHYRGKGMPAEVLTGLRDRLYDGLMLQLVSMPISLRVEEWLLERRPDLAPQQRAAITRQLQENLSTLKPEVKQMAPEAIVRPSLAMNAGFAAFWSRRWDDPLVSMPYRSAKLGQPGTRLLDLFDAKPSDPAHDRALIEAWAEELGLVGWYEWVPHTLEDA